MRRTTGRIEGESMEEVLLRLRVVTDLEDVNVDVDLDVDVDEVSLCVSVTYLFIYSPIGMLLPHSRKEADTVGPPQQPVCVCVFVNRGRRRRNLCRTILTYRRTYTHNT